MGPLMLALLLAQAPTVPPRLEDGIRLVEQGDFEAAVTALRGVAAAIAGDPTRAVERARAYLYLGVAQLALGQTADAHASFVAAVRDDPSLRVGADRYSPKVVTAFETARREQLGTKASKGGGSGGRIAVAAVAGAAVAVGAVVALGGSNKGIRIENARFATPEIECPNNANALPLAYSVLADVINEGSTTSVLSTIVTAIIVASSEPEVGFSDQRPSVATPSSLPGGRTTTVRLDSTLLCSNDAGGPSRSNEWTARFTITTSAGTAAGETTNRMRVSIP